MNTLFLIALRNLARNRRRSIFTLLAIGFGFAAVNVFAGFTDYLFTSLRDGFIYYQGNGHLTVYKKDFLTDGQSDPKKYLLTESDVAAIRAVCAADSRVMLVTPKLYVSGMISNGRTTTIALASGIVPSEVALINSRATGTIGRAKVFTGEPLRDDVAANVGTGSDLARKLKFDLGSDAVLMGQTLDGQMNALDIKIVQTFEAPIDVLNDKLMVIPLPLAQSLYDTHGVDRLCILLKNTADTDPVRAEIENALAAKGPQVEIKAWNEISDMYSRTKKMFDIIFLFIFVIVMVIVVMSVINTVSMSVMERIQEIGTVRAIGLKRRGVLKLFAIESAMLGIFGCAAGSIFTLVSWSAVKLAKPVWVPPEMSRNVPLEVYLVPNCFLISFICLVALSVLAAVFPARKAARLNIVEALGHV